MLSLRFCFRIALGILIAFAGLAVVAYADELPTIEFAGPAIAEKPIRPIQVAEPIVDVTDLGSETENVLTNEPAIEVVITKVEIILPINITAEPKRPAGPAIAEKPIVGEVLEVPVVAEVTKEPVVVEQVEELKTVELVQSPVVGPAVAEKPVRILAKLGPAVAEKPAPVEIEFVEVEVAAVEVTEVEVTEVEVTEVEVAEVEVAEVEVAEVEVAEVEVAEVEVAEVEVAEVEVAEVEVLEVKATTSVAGPAVAEAGPHRHSSVAIVADAQPEQQLEIHSHDWFTLIAPQISPPAWLVCQWLFAE